MKKPLTLLATLVMSAGWTLILATPALAVCHLVAISANPNPAPEDKNVKITVTRTIVGGGCTGNVEYRTQDGTAKAPSDYKSIPPSTFSFTNPTQSTFEFTVELVDDKTFEADENFEAHFKHTPTSPPHLGDPSAVRSGSVVVTIKDNDPSPAPPPAGTTPKASPTPTTTASPTAAPTTGASPGTPLVIAGSPTPTGSPTPLAGGKTPEKKGASTGLIIGGIAILLAAGAGVGLWFLRKTPA